MSLQLLVVSDQTELLQVQALQHISDDGFFQGVDYFYYVIVSNVPTVMMVQ
jgi:hypothetical protein